jgi:hypothetical protein
MKRIVDVFKKKDRALVWTYVISLDRKELPSGIASFETEALRLSMIDDHGTPDTLLAKVRLS